MPWDFKTTGEYARSLAAMVAVVSLPVAGAWYIFQLEGRLRTAEAQIQALATQPSRGTDVTGTDVTGTDVTVSTGSNAIAEACVEVYKRVAELRAKKLKAAEAAMRDLWVKLCDGGGGN
jgi:hypothetical protein